MKNRIKELGARLNPQRLPLSDDARLRIKIAAEVSGILTNYQVGHAMFGSLALAMQLGWFYRNPVDIDFFLDIPGTDFALFRPVEDRVNGLITQEYGPSLLHFRPRTVFDDQTFLLPTLPSIEQRFYIRDISFPTEFGPVRTIPFSQGESLLSFSPTRKASQDLAALRRLGAFS